MERFEGVANTLFIPLGARIRISHKFPEYFYDEKALSLESYLPLGAEKGSSEYSDMASVARYFAMDKIAESFFSSFEECNIAYLGAGLETAYDRLLGKTGGHQVHFYEIDLPEVIEARRKVLGERENETLIGEDIFKMAWADKLDPSLPTLLIVSGVFQYFHEEEVIKLIRECKEIFPLGEMVFDATSSSGLKFTNWFIKRTGNKSALMHFYVDDGKEFADKCDVSLLEVKTFFPEALSLLRKKLKFITKISMKVAERKKQAIIVHLRLNR